MSKSMKRLVSLTLIFVTVCAFAAPMVTKVSGAPQEVYVPYELSDFTAYDRYESMSKEELLALPGALNCFSEVPTTSCTDDDPIVYTVVVVDDTMKQMMEGILQRSCTWSEVKDWAYNILEAGDDPFFSTFSINFYIVKYWCWEIGRQSLLDELYMAQKTFWPLCPDWYDCMVIMSGNMDGLTIGWSELLGDAFIMCVGFFGIPLANVFQHEASHLYDANDHKGWSALFTWCIMSYMWSALTRSWCGGCKDKINSNKWVDSYIVEVDPKDSKLGTILTPPQTD